MCKAQPGSWCSLALALQGRCPWPAVNCFDSSFLRGILQSLLRHCHFQSLCLSAQSQRQLSKDANSGCRALYLPIVQLISDALSNVRTVLIPWSLAILLDQHAFGISDWMSF